ncbi:hypothetical protein C8Q72DRAFT_806895 [Fomitopsis betulina]|nr:hypothetical protein C8Q72DRAFT_806895 [Fomitopsis betulina]
MPRNKSARETKTVDAGADSRFTIGGGSIFGAPRATIRQPLLRQLLEEPLQLHNQLIAETPPCGHTTLAMAKASSSTPRPSSAQPYHSAHVLRRNQACHQCRRRKLKCDAKRPCSTCVRSHSYAVAHAPAGAELPPHPHCTFDEVSEGDSDPEPFENPKARFERLEGRINELESLLREKETESNSPSGSITHHKKTSDNLIPSTQLHGATQGIHSYGASSSSLEPGMMVIDPALQFQSGSPLDSLAGVASLMGAPGPSRITTIPSVSEQSDDSQVPSSGHVYDVTHTAWPRNLPNPPFLRHLVDAFFMYHPDATRMFHQTTFLSTLLLHPTHPKFPAVCVLHAICAVGSMYTAAIPSPEIPSGPGFSAFDIFPKRWKSHDEGVESFAEMQANLTKVAIEAATQVGMKLFQIVQAEILLAWWYWSNAKWADAYLTSASAMRYAVPCGLNICPPFHTISETLRPTSLLPPASSVIEDECRRNTFWIGYTLERGRGMTDGWAMSLDDQDIAQLLPLRRDQFEQGALVFPQDRQWSHDKDMLTTHPEGQVDGFILYVKSIIVLSHIKYFNLRFRSKYHAGEASTKIMNTSNPMTHTYRYSGANGEPIDPRQTPAFLQMDQLVTAFRASFPGHLRNPAREQVDPHLFSACCASHCADIQLHEPHAIVGKDNCMSSCRIVTASRAILDLLYHVCSTSYDLTFLGIFPMICWFMAGRVLVRFLHAAISRNSEEQILTLWAEVDYIRTVFFRLGENIPFAHRYGKMLHDFLVQSCGERYAAPAPLLTQDLQSVDTMPSQNGVYGSTSIQAIPTPPS